MNISCIYKISSIQKPMRIYIGSAVNYRKRKRSHLSDLRRGVHNNRKLQNHFNKYGEHDLQFDIITSCNEKELIQQEQFFIDIYKPYFNIRPFANSGLGLKMSKEAKSKLSKLGKKIPKEHFNKMQQASRRALEVKSDRKTYTLTCVVCGSHYDLTLTKNVYDNKKFRKCCSSKCSHLLSGSKSKSKLQGKNNPNYGGKAMTPLSIMKFKASRKGYKHSALSKIKTSRTVIRKKVCQRGVDQHCLWK